MGTLTVAMSIEALLLSGEPIMFSVREGLLLLKVVVGRALPGEALKITLKKNNPTTFKFIKLSN